MSECKSLAKSTLISGKKSLIFILLSVVILCEQAIVCVKKKGGSAVGSCFKINFV